MTFPITLTSRKRQALDLFHEIIPWVRIRLKYTGGMEFPSTLTSWKGQFLDNIFIFNESKKGLKETWF